VAKLSVTVCDECQSLERKTTSYRVLSDGRVGTADLCDLHNRPLEALLRTIGTRPTRAVFSDQVVTMEEIEARKSRR